MIKGFILFHIAVLHGHVAMKNGGFNMAEKGKRVIFRFFNKDYQLMVGAAKILSVLGESKDASLHNFQHGLAALPCCNKKWQIQHGRHCSYLYVWKPIISRSKGIKRQICFCVAFLMIIKCTKFCWKIYFCSRDLAT